MKDPADGEMKRTPKGCLCLICRNVFSAIGYEMEFSGFKSYKKVMTTPLGQEKHSNFLRSLSMWIAKHNCGEKTIRGKTELMQVHRKVQVEKAAKAGFKGRKKVFIEEKNWDPKRMAHGMRANWLKKRSLGKQDVARTSLLAGKVFGKPRKKRMSPSRTLPPKQ